MKRYKGKREGFVAEVTVDGRPLNPRLDLWNHSPSGFEWGYPGSGPAQLALALLADYLADEEQAVLHHQAFKSAVVAGLPYRGWTMTGLQIKQAVENIKSQPLVLQPEET